MRVCNYIKKIRERTEFSKTANMGMDYYACSECGEPFTSYDDYTHCSGCNRRYCDECGDGNAIFYIDIDEEYDTRCVNCLHVGYRPVRDGELLEYILKKLGRTVEDVAVEFRETDEYKESLHTLTCTSCEYDACKNIAEVFQGGEGLDYTNNISSVCCTCRHEIFKDTTVIPCDLCNNKKFMKHWMGVHVAMRNAGAPKDLVNSFGKRTREFEGVLTSWK